MENHALFPVIVSKFDYAFNDSVKDFLFSERAIEKFFKDGISCEPIFNALHHERELSGFYKFVTASVASYLEACAVDPETFDIMMHKSWLNVGQGEGNPQHDHSDSHISFCYYVNAPFKNSLRFYSTNRNQEPYDGFFETYVKDGNWNVFNSRSWSFPPVEGGLFVFPARLPHAVDGEIGKKAGIKSVDDLKKCRVAIAGDVLLVGKKVIVGNYRAVQPPTFWRKFD